MNTEKCVNLSQNLNGDNPYNETDTTILVQITQRTNPIPMQNIDNVIKTLMESYAPLRDNDTGGTCVKFRASEIELTIECNRGNRSDDPSSGEPA